MESLLTLPFPLLKHNWPLYPLLFPLEGPIHCFWDTLLFTCVSPSMHCELGEDRTIFLIHPCPLTQWQSYHRYSFNTCWMNFTQAGSGQVRIHAQVDPSSWSALLNTLRCLQETGKNCVQLHPGHCYQYFEDFSPNNLEMREIRLSSLTGNCIINI